MVLILSSDSYAFQAYPYGLVQGILISALVQSGAQEYDSQKMKQDSYFILSFHMPHMGQTSFSRVSIARTCPV